MPKHNNTSVDTVKAAESVITYRTPDLGEVTDNGGIFLAYCKVCQADVIGDSLPNVRAQMGVHLVDSHGKAVEFGPDGDLIVSDKAPEPVILPTEKREKTVYKCPGCKAEFAKRSLRQAHQKDCKAYLAKKAPKPEPIAEPAPVVEVAPVSEPEPVIVAVPEPEPVKMTPAQAWEIVDRLMSVAGRIEARSQESASFFTNVKAQLARLDNLKKVMPVFERSARIGLMTTDELHEFQMAEAVLDLDIARQQASPMFAVGQLVADDVARINAATEKANQANARAKAGNDALNNAIHEWQNEQETFFQRLLTGAVQVPSKKGPITLLEDCDWLAAHSIKDLPQKDDESVAALLTIAVRNRLDRLNFAETKTIDVKVMEPDSQGKVRPVKYSGIALFDLDGKVSLMVKMLMRLRRAFNNAMRASKGKIRPAFKDLLNDPGFIRAFGVEQSPKVEQVLDQNDLSLSSGEYAPRNAMQAAWQKAVKAQHGGKGDVNTAQPSRK